MNNEREISEVHREIGLSMHKAQTAIWMGRSAISEIMAHEPIDVAAVAEQQQVVQSGRADMRELRAQLKSIKRGQIILAPSGWQKYE